MLKAISWRALSAHDIAYAVSRFLRLSRGPQFSRKPAGRGPHRIDLDGLILCILCTLRTFVRIAHLPVWTTRFLVRATRLFAERIGFGNVMHSSIHGGGVPEEEEEEEEEDYPGPLTQTGTIPYFGSPVGECSNGNRRIAYRVDG
jgi:hypothetical protein